MILVLAGTQDGRQLAACIMQAGYQAIVSVVSRYGKELASKSNLIVNVDKLDLNAMLAFIKANGIKIIVDASHPYAVNVSKNAIRASQISNIKYVRYERPMISLPQYDKLHTAASYEEAAIKTADFGVNVFLTIGSRMLDKFKNEPKLKNHRLIARVLPDPVVIADCIKLGFSLNDIIGMQGPFSHAMNLAMFKDFNANVIVMKNSGQIGGSGTKLSAAIELNLPIIMIDRPILQYPNVMTNYSDILCYIKEVF